jgi:hypothetical protein
VLLHGSLLLAMENARSRVASYTGGYFQITIGVLALLIAAVLSTGFPVQLRAGAATYDGTPSAPALQPRTPTASARMRARIRHALQGGNPWVAFGIGLVTTMPLVDYLVVLILIVSSGAAIGIQLGAVVAFTLVVLVLVEVPLVSYLVMPAKTQMVMSLLERWVATHRRRLLAAVPAAVGLMLVTAGVTSM